MEMLLLSAGEADLLRNKLLQQRNGVAEKVFHKLANFFNSLHWGIGITTLPGTATPREERSFALLWLGIIVFVIVFLVVLVYLLGRF